MQAKDWDVFCSMTLTEILMSLLDSLPDSDKIRFRFQLGLSVRSLLATKVLFYCF